MRNLELGSNSVRGKKKRRNIKKLIARKSADRRPNKPPMQLARSLRTQPHLPPADFVAKEP